MPLPEYLVNALPSPETGFDDPWQQTLASDGAKGAPVVTIPIKELSLARDVEAREEYLHFRHLGIIRHLLIFQDGDFFGCIDRYGKPCEPARYYIPNIAKPGVYTDALLAMAEDKASGSLSEEEYNKAFESAVAGNLEATEWASYLEPRQTEE